MVGNRVRKHERHVEVDAHEARRPLLGQRGRDDGAPIAALSHVARVAKGRMSSLQARAMRAAFQPRSAGLSEKAKPGKDGTTTWKASSARPP